MSACHISIVIPAHNAESTLASLLAALSAQVDARDDAETILVDSGSIDRTREIASGAGVRIVAASRSGASAARNAGVRAARGALIAFLDSDCIPQPGWLEAIVEPFQSVPAIGVAGGRVLAAPPAGLLQLYAQQAGYYISQEISLAHPFLPYVLTANCCYRHEVIERLGGFDETLRSGEDTALAWRMQLELGLEVTYVPAAVVEHVHRSTLTGIWRQWVRYGYGGVQLEERFPGRSGAPAGAGAGSRFRRLLRELHASFTALVRLAFGRATALDVAAPLLRCFEVSADRAGRWQALRASRARDRR